jgi:hypothetical protein
VVILAAKFAEGAWLTVIVIPCTIILLRLVRRYYDEIGRQVLTGGDRQINLWDDACQPRATDTISPAPIRRVECGCLLRSLAIADG